jgi:hypothetical protein
MLQRLIIPSVYDKNNISTTKITIALAIYLTINILCVLTVEIHDRYDSFIYIFIVIVIPIMMWAYWFQIRIATISSDTLRFTVFGVFTISMAIVVGYSVYVFQWILGSTAGGSIAIILGGWLSFAGYTRLNQSTTNFISYRNSTFNQH